MICSVVSSSPGAWNRKQIGEFAVRQITTNTIAPALDRIKVYSAKFLAEHEAKKTETTEKSRAEILRDVIERRESGVEEERVAPKLPQGGESEKERGE